MYLIFNEMYLMLKNFFFNLKKKKKFGDWVVRFFVSDVISGGLSGHLDQLHLALGPNRKMVVFS